MSDGRIGGRACDANRHYGGTADSLGAADWLSLAAAPAFAMMALLTVAHGRRPGGHPLLGRARCVAAERNDRDVPADERLPFGALAEVDLPPAKSARRSYQGNLAASLSP